MKLNLAFTAPLVIFAGLGAAFYIGLQRENADELPSTFVSRPAPAVDVIPLGDLALLTSADLKEPGLKLVNFWASWCAPCRSEHPMLVELAASGLAVYGINKSDKEANALGFLNELGNPFAKQGADPTGRRGIDWGVYGLPETFLVDENGHILTRYPGPLTKRVWAARFQPIIDAQGQ